MHKVVVITNMKMKKKKKFGLKILSVAMVASLMVPTSIGNIAVFAETAEPVTTENTLKSEPTFAQKKEFQIKKGTEDAEVSASAVNLTSTGLDLHGVVSGVPQATYLRFSDVTLPSDAKISNAYLSFTTRDASSASQSTTISITGERGSQAEFSNTVASFTNRNFTDASVSMATPVVATNTIFNTEDITSVLNEMRADQTDIQNYVFKIAGNNKGSFVMRSYDSSATMAPKLIVEYTSPSADYKANIANTADDAKEYGANKTMDLNSAMEIGGYYSATLTPAYRNISAFRFANVNLPENAKIDDAYLEFTTYGTVANRVSNMSIASELGNPLGYTSVAGNISSRPYTASTVKYQQASFTAANQVIRTPNLKSIIDETRLMGWQNGNALAFRVDGDNYIGSIYQGGSAVAYQPKLVIKYTYSEQDAVAADVVKNPAKMKNLFINEVASAGTDAEKNGWIEIFNNNDVPVFFENGVFLSDDITTLGKSELKNLYIPAKGYRVVKADGTQNNASVHFTLGDRATKLYLSTKYDDSFHTMDTMDVRPMSFNETMGRLNDGDSNVVTFKPGTYESSNNDANQIVSVTASQKTGLYAKPFDLAFASDAVNTIKYTTDGSTPSETNGTTYTKPFTINKNTTVKAFAYNAKQNSGVQTFTYAIREDADKIPLATKEYSVKAGTDDAAVAATTVNLTSTALNLHGLLNAAPQATFVRFANVAIPADAVITKAYLTFTTLTASSTPTNLAVAGEIGNGDAFASTVASFTNRKLTETTVKSATPDKVAVNDLVNTGDLTAVIDEMRAGNPDMKNLVFRVDGDKTGSYIARSYESSAAMAPKLVLEYYSGDGDFAGQVATANDDAEEYGTAKAMSLNDNLRIGGYYSTTLTPGYKDISAFRFNNVTLPESAEIEDAYLEFTTYATNAAKVSSNMEVRAELGNPEIYKSTAGNITSRAYSELAVKYNQPAFTAGNQIVRTANLKDIIDENRLTGWKNGQSMAFRIDGDNYIGSVYQGGNANAARLIIQYKNNAKGPSIDGALTTPDKIKNVFINELSSEGTASSKEAWIELYNDNDVPVILDKGMYLSDKAKTLDKFEFSNLVIPAKGYRVLYSDKATELGNNHLSFEIGGSGDVILSAKVGSEFKTVDSIKYTKQAYNQSFGRQPDASKNLTLFSSDTFGKSNNNGQTNYAVQFSKNRGMYDTAFDLTMTSKPGITLKYTLDGTTPSETKGTTYTGPITIGKTTVVKVYGYDATGNTGVLSNTYVLRDNYKNEVTSGSQWQYKTNITSDDYAQAIDDFPVVSVTGDATNLNGSTDTAGTFEYLDSHMGNGGTNYFNFAGSKKFGQASVSQFNSGVAIKFHRDFNGKKAKYNFFDPLPGEVYPVVGKFSKLQLKEGQDGPQNDVYNLGYNRYDEKVTGTLAEQMGKIFLHTNYVHYYYNGKYMGVKTMRENFSQNMFEEYFGGDGDDYTKIRFQDGYFVPGHVETGDGDTAILTKVKAVSAAKSFQEFKNYVDVEDLIKTQILFMFTDTEQEVDAVVSNSVLTGNGGTKMKFNINDTDGAFYNNGGTGTSSSSFTGGGGTYRYKWADGNSRRGAGVLFGNFSGDSSTVATAGNLEFKTLVKDQVLKQIGPANGDFAGASGAPLSVANVRQLILDNQKQLDAAYKLDAAYMGARRTIYQDWLAAQVKTQAQVPDRVRYNLEMWTKYGMAHTLQSVNVVSSGTGVILENPNAGTDVYYTTDGTDPMGADGVVSSQATKYIDGTVLDAKIKLTIRAFKTNNWGPMIDNGAFAEQAQKEDAATKAVQALFTNDDVTSGSIKKETNQKAIDVAQKAVDAVADVATRAVLQNDLNTAKELLANRGKTSGTITANDFIIGTDSYVKGTYTGDVAKIALEINGTLQQIINATGSPYQYYAKGKINAVTDQVNMIGYDKDGNELQKTKVNVQKPTVGQLTLNPFYLGKDNYVTGQFSCDVAKISLTVNDVEGTKIIVSAPDFKYYANNVIRNVSDIVKLTAYDNVGKVLDTKAVTVLNGISLPGSITTIAPFKIGKDSYVTGTFTGDVVKVELQINKVALQRINVTDGTIKYYAKTNITKTTDIIELVGYNTAGNIVSTKIVPVTSANGNVTVNPFLLGTDGYVKGQFTGDVARISLTVNNVKQTTINVPTTGPDFQYYAKTLIKNRADIVSLTAYDSLGGEIQTVSVPIL
ncbi:immunoglobulin-like domain-containing protein [Paenilisteria newyorkensis]|uniref:immunoglobulin-like domain-containing protein n=1 Tax=Listeria newyorkensis TaxID=1497681 RepID=UPI002358E287|nr:immunoglobulin-like domain-containing protein [Listeria newyorkensis]WAO21717.1 FN3 associated domain-containing protein [Listeria newyorkensis]